jgi:hypothetical protein
MDMIIFGVSLLSNSSAMSWWRWAMLETAAKVASHRPLGRSFDLLVVGGSRMSQQSRRHDPYPWTWEIPLSIVLVILMVLACGVHLGRGIANVMAGAGWTFPGRVELFRSLPAVLGGDARAGLDGLNGPMSSPSAVWTWVVVTEVMLLAVSVFVLKLVLDRWGPGRLRGMASRGEAERLLGVTRLRKVRSVVRPDLYGKNRDH